MARQGGDILLICAQLKYTLPFVKLKQQKFIGLGLVDPFNFANFMMIVFYPEFNGNC